MTLEPALRREHQVAWGTELISTPASNFWPPTNQMVKFLDVKNNVLIETFLQCLRCSLHQCHTANLPLYSKGQDLIKN